MPQAGARKVYAVEASRMSECAKRLLETNPYLGARISVIHGKVSTAAALSRSNASRRCNVAARCCNVVRNC